MKRKFALQAAYLLVTSAFTLSLLVLVLVLIDLFDGPRKRLGLNTTANLIELTIGGGIPAVKISAILEQAQEEVENDESTNNQGNTDEVSSMIKERIDTLAIFNDDLEYISVPSTKLSLDYFRKSRTVPYFFLQGRVIATILIWQFLLYQLFLVLYDLKRDLFFIARNILRMKRIGYSFLAMALLHCISFGFNTFLTSKNEIVIGSENFIRLFYGNSLLYTAVGTIVIVLSWVFYQGRQLKEENELTV